jgi:hypothetical protein
MWKRLICGNQSKMSAVLYKLLYTMHNRNFFHSKCSIENILNECGYSEYWLTQNVPKSVCLSKNVKQRLCDQFKQRWYTTVYTTQLTFCFDYHRLAFSTYQSFYFLQILL